MSPPAAAVNKVCCRQNDADTDIRREVLIRHHHELLNIAGPAEAFNCLATSRPIGVASQVRRGAIEESLVIPSIPKLLGRTTVLVPAPAMATARPSGGRTRSDGRR